MSAAKRMLETLCHGAPDRTPFFEYVLLSPVADCLLGRPYRDYAGDTEDWCAYAREAGWETALRQYVTDRLDIAEKLGHDLLYVVPNPIPSAISPLKVTDHAGAGASPAGHPFGGDPVAAIQKRIEADLESLDNPLDADAFLVYDLLREEMKRRGMEAFLLAPAYFHGVWTDTDLLQAIALSPETAHRHFETATRKALRNVEAYIELGIELIGVGGDFAGKRPIISPESYRTFIVPEIRRLSARIREAGGYSVNASDGNLWSVIEDFLIGCGVDGYLEIDANAGMSLKELKAAYGGRITFFGNMDCGQSLSFCTAEEIRQLTYRCLEEGSGRGGHVFCASNAITGSVPVENYMAMVNAYKDFFSLPRINVGG